PSLPPSCALHSAAPPPTSSHTLSLHDALPIFRERRVHIVRLPCRFIVFSAGKFQIRRVPFHHRRKVTSSEHGEEGVDNVRIKGLDRKSTRLNSSHQIISYAVFCLKKKNKQYLE